MFEGLSKEEWIRWERVEHDFHAHPVLYRMRLAALFAEGLIVSIFLLAIIVLMVVVCVVNPLDNLRLIAFLVFNGFYTAVTYYRILLWARFIIKKANNRKLANSLQNRF